MKKTVLIVTKHPNSKGGVVNYYNHFFKVFEDDNFELKWFTVGSRPKDYQNRKNRKFAYLFESIKDIFRFIRLLFTNRSIKIVQVSPSFMPVPVVRDFIYLFLAKFFGKKTVTFFRGWSVEFEKKMLSNPGSYKHILKFYNRSDAILILAEKFKSVLVSIGLDANKIHITRTMYVQSDILSASEKRSEDLKFLFIGRVSFEKGIIDILDAVKLLNDEGVNIDVDIYGHYANQEVESISKQKIKEYDLKDQVCIHSFISGTVKYEKLSAADVFLFPTYHDEGCPNSVIEALASGLFVISTPIGAIDEIVKDGVNGLIIEPKAPRILANSIKWAVENRNEVRSKGEGNATHAEENFEQEVIVDKIRTIYNNL